MRKLYSLSSPLLSHPLITPHSPPSHPSPILLLQFHTQLNHSLVMRKLYSLSSPLLSHPLITPHSPPSHPSPILLLQFHTQLNHSLVMRKLLKAMPICQRFAYKLLNNVNDDQPSLPVHRMNACLQLLALDDYSNQTVYRDMYL